VFSKNAHTVIVSDDETTHKFEDVMSLGQPDAEKLIVRF
jgi:hypothetical protein